MVRASRGSIARRGLVVSAAAWAPMAYAQAPAVDLARPLVSLALLALIGLTVWLIAPQWLRWVGRLPGDLRFGREGTRIYIPITTAIVLSLALSLLSALLGVLPALGPYLWGWFGTLPGDVRIRRNGVTLFFPLTSMLVLSLLLSALVSGLGWLARRRGRSRNRPD